ncbi:MAG: cyclopropane-fatty-acyl-phospholipid synthase family protein [Rhizomicrobium sp.]|jgi:cyclopropane-fatty-acyl-phospholipid synthase
MTDASGNTSGTFLDRLAIRRRSFVRMVSLDRLLGVVGAHWQAGSLRVTAPDGKEFHLKGMEPGPDAGLVVHDLRALRRLVWSGDIGFAEGYFAGEWDTPDLPALLHAIVLNLRGAQGLLRGTRTARLINLVQHVRNRNSRSGARRNIEAHYDLGNSFYERWLDRSMTYSSGVFGRDAATLDDAQQRKYRRLAETIALEQGHSVLEIGCGWGGFAEFAARDVGAHVTAITISPSQHAYASARMQKAGLADRVDVRLVDYRDVKGMFDRIVSIEMLEAVGEKFWPQYFATIRDVLAPGGIVGLQTITIADRFFAQYRKRVDFIQKYMFPGGMLPAEFRLRQEADAAGLAWRGSCRFGEDYARTLSEWARNFGSAWGDIRGLGFDERFRRLWLFYLAYCEAGFRSRRIDVIQLALQKA